MNLPYLDFIRMQVERQLFMQKSPDRFYIALKQVFGKIYDDKIVAIADIIFRFEPMLGELIELIHIDIRKELASDVSQR